ncbi:hypothetical protein BDW60DRAFT_164297 [Aspergillus nidulans var. acristatus]
MDLSLSIELLRLGSTGPNVTTLHLALLRVLYCLDPVEVVSATFGLSTRQSVVDFQSDQKLSTNGIVDEATAVALLASSDCPAAERKFFVFGRVLHPNGSPGAGLEVTISNRDLRRCELLASIHADDAGYFHGKYDLKQFARAEKGTADISVRIQQGNEVLYEPTIDTILFNAPDLAIINISLTKGVSSITDEFNTITNSIRPLFKRQEVDFADLREDKDVRDVTFLVRESGLNDTKIRHVLVAFRLNRNYKIVTEFFYAIFAKQVLATSSKTDASSVRTDIGLQTDLVSLFYDIVLLSPDAIKSIVQSAVNDKIVPGRLIGQVPGIQKQLDEWRRKAEEYVKQRPAQDQIFSQAKSLFTEGSVDAIVSIIQKDTSGNLASVLDDLEAAMAATPPATAEGKKKKKKKKKRLYRRNLKADIASVSPTFLVREVGRLKKTTAEIELAKLSTEDWEDALTHKELPTANATPEARKSHANVVFKTMEKKYPTATFTAQLSRNKSSVFGDASGSDLVDVLQHNADFNLAHGNVDILLKNTRDPKDARASTTENAATARMLKSVQRVFRLAPTFTQTKHLLENGLESSFAIRSLGQARFLREFASQPDHPFTPTEGLSIFRGAADVHLAAGFLAGNFHSASAALRLQGMSNALPPAKLEAVMKDFPNMKSLFQLGEACACDDCMTVHSASAYVVDTLSFLDRRQVIDTTDPSKPEGAKIEGARKFLFSRRPDLGDLDLSCDNTNTPLPYIDVVCELLEDAVAPDGGFPVTGALTPGIISPELLTVLQGQGLAFTDKATVAGPDKSSNSFVVRDMTIVVKLTPNSGSSTDWTGRIIRQTYGSAESLAATPYYQNNAAYDRLSVANYAFNLPFDLAHQETAAYFAQFDIPRARLMRALQNATSPTEVDIACEELGIASAERTIITSPDPDGQEKYWNTGAADPVTGMHIVDTFVTKVGITYPDLQTMLGLGQGGPTSWLDPENKMFIRHFDNTCNLVKKEIANLEKDGLDRLHRFIRMLRKVIPLGWDIQSLDRAIAADRLGKNKLDDDCIEKIAELKRLKDRLGSASRIRECVAFYDVFSLEGDSSVFATVFLNPIANGKIDPDFTAESIKMNVRDEHNNPGTGKKISAYTDYLSLCLGRSSSDVALLLQSLPKHGDDVLAPESISSVYERHIFALRSNISIPELIPLRALTGIDELKGPAEALALLDALAEIKSSGLTPTDLQYFLRHEASDVEERILHDEKITKLIQGLRTGYDQAKKNNVSTFDENASLADNISATTTLAAKIPGFTSTDTAKLQSIISNKWTDPTTTPQAFIDSKFGPSTKTDDIKSVQAALSAAIPENLEDLQFAFIKVLDQALSSYFTRLDIHDFLGATIVQNFSISEDLERLVLPLLKVEASQNRSIEEILTDALLVGDAPLPPIDPTKFNAQFRSLRLLFIVLAFVKKMNLSKDDIEWLLKNKPPWMVPDAVRYQSDVPAVSFESWQMLWDAIQFTREFPPVVSLTNKDVPLSIYGFFELAMKSGSTIDIVLNYLSQVTGWDEATLKVLNTRFGMSVGNYKTPEALTALKTPLALLRTMHLDLSSAVQLIKPKLLSSDAAVMRKALKGLYSDSLWLGVLKNIMDPLRLLKRDALVNFLLAANPSMKDANDLYDYFLIDVEMGSKMSTSRIVQAHATIQLFVQRCLMGLEPQSVADRNLDSGWAEWSWMANFRDWEVNRKVFLWPENWIEPALRDDKSEIFKDLENTIQQNQLSTPAAQSAVITYLERLNDISQLDVVATYYQTSAHMSHVFARTKGGDPKVYYYRQFQQERYWTPWEKIDVDITGDHIVAFDRNNRLALAWLELKLETFQRQDVPIPQSGGGSTGNQFQRWVYNFWVLLPCALVYNFLIISCTKLRATFGKSIGPVNSKSCSYISHTFTEQSFCHLTQKLWSD